MDPILSKTSVTDAESVRVDTFVRERSADGLVRAEGRVAEYLRTLGLLQNERVDVLARRFALEGLTPVRAVELAQAALERFLTGLFDLEPDNVDPLWLRAFIAGCPDLFLSDDVLAARKAAARFGDPRAFKAEKHAKFQQQALRPMRIPGWLGGLLGASAVTLGATAGLVRGLAADGLNPGELLWAAMFAGLFGLGGIGFTIALIGFVTGFRRTEREREREPTDAAQALPRSALVMPIYEEDAGARVRGLAAMRESLAHTPGGEAFEIFVLSDSRRPEQVAEEERAFRRVARLPVPVNIPVFYRRRAINERQKAGNLGEFFERFGHRYKYAIMLDADSLMRGDTLVEMVHRMEAQPKVALLQAPLFLHARHDDLLARAAAGGERVRSDVHARSRLSCRCRMATTTATTPRSACAPSWTAARCPCSTGQPPLGGHILSHDFVEAALLCRAGWEVRIADDLVGSWEELPAHLPDYVARDRRWCQGNLQHLRVALAEGFKPMSRLHMLVGAGAYLAGPAWLYFHCARRRARRWPRTGPLVPAAIALPLTHRHRVAAARAAHARRCLDARATGATRAITVAHCACCSAVCSSLRWARCSRRCSWCTTRRSCCRS